MWFFFLFPVVVTALVFWRTLQLGRPLGDATQSLPRARPVESSVFLLGLAVSVAVPSVGVAQERATGMADRGVLQPTPCAPESLLLRVASTAHIQFVQLDGEGGVEAVVRTRTPMSNSEGSTARRWVDRVGVYHCILQTPAAEAGDEGPVARPQWVEAGAVEIAAEEDNGTLDSNPGLRYLEFVPLPGGGHLLAVVEEHAQSGADPRWLQRSVTMWSLASGQLTQVWRCGLVQENESGPCRAGVSTEWQVRISDTQWIEVSRSDTPHSGACEGDAGDPTIVQASFRWNGSWFVAMSPDAEAVCGF